MKIRTSSEVGRGLVKPTQSSISFWNGRESGTEGSGSWTHSVMAGEDSRDVAGVDAGEFSAEET